MNRVLLVLAVIVIVASSGFRVSWAGEEDTTVQLAETIRVGQSGEIVATFADLTETGRQAGLREAVVKGHYKTIILPDKRSRISIIWDSIVLPANTPAGAVTEKLRTPLRSTVSTLSGDINPPQRFSARGDMEAVIDAVESAKTKMSQAGQPKHLVENKETVMKQASVPGAMFPAGSPANSGSPLGGSSASPATDYSASLMLEGWEDCPPRIDEAKEKLFMQRKEVVRNANGDILSAGTCGDTGDVVEGTRVYTCEPVADWSVRKVFPYYRLVATYQGANYTLKDCQKDSDAGMDILATADGCEVIFDTENGISVETERYYYANITGKRIYLSDCSATNRTNKLKATHDGCDYAYDFGNHSVVETERLYYPYKNGTIKYLTECRPSNRSQPILASTEGCGYSYDFTAHAAVENERLYFRGRNGAARYLSECQASVRSYPLYEYNCGVVVDLPNLGVTTTSRVAFKLPTDEVKFATECRPTPGQGLLPIRETFCDPKYEHDLTNGISYYRTRSYYNDPVDQQVVYVTECARSSSTSFAHTHDSSACTIANDDINKVSQYYAQTKVTTPDEITPLRDCSPVGPPVPYTPVTLDPITAIFDTPGTHTWIVPSGVNIANVELLGGGGIRSSDTYCSDTFNGCFATPLTALYSAGCSAVAKSHTASPISGGQAIVITVGGVGRASSFGHYVSAPPGDQNVIAYLDPFVWRTGCDGSGNPTSEAQRKGASTFGVGEQEDGSGGSGGYVKITYTPVGYRRSDGTTYFTDK